LEIEEYYRSVYPEAQRKGLQGIGNRIMDWSLLRKISIGSPKCMLELGAASGEFTGTAVQALSPENYVAFDLKPGLAIPGNFDRIRREAPQTILTVQEGNAENLPFASDSFDVTFSTCLLAHVDNPGKVVRESIRVTRKGGRVVFLLPSDPGLLNQATKRLFTYPKLKRLGVARPQLLYALEHKNPIHNLIAVIDSESDAYRVNWISFPFLIKSWNLSLFMVVTIDP